MQPTEVEVWKQIQDYPLYEISNLGNCRRLDAIVKRKDGRVYYHKGRFLKSAVDSSGYNQYILFKNGCRKTFSAHRLVAEYFIPNPYSFPEVNHKNGIKTDNRASQLEWTTRKENIQHAVDTGLMKRGGQLPYSKLVLDTANGIFYDSIVEAANATGINYRTLQHWLCGDRKNKSSLIFV